MPKTNPIKSISKITIPKFNIIRKKRTVTHKSKPNKLFTTNSIFLSIIIIIIGFMALYYFGIFGIVKECKDLDCYYEYLETCKKSHLITETNDSVFRYEILKKNGDNYCNVEVRLIKVKSNGIDSEEIEGLNMICKVNKHDQAIPDRDMQACSGRLREVFQEIIIDRLHNQILKNLPQIIEELDT